MNAAPCRIGLTRPVCHASGMRLAWWFVVLAALPAPACTGDQEQALAHEVEEGRVLYASNSSVNLVVKDIRALLAAA